ncbi:transcriptional repressor [Blyttiomyces sp. JEL0837]|nr:transcriptional repressor [Blyttiomyces sp. JEL0837]
MLKQQEVLMVQQMGAISNSGGEASPKREKKKHICNHEGCGKVFTTSGHLARHRKLHSGVKGFTCPVPGCPNKFARRDNMVQHAKSHFRKLAQQQGLAGLTHLLDPKALQDFLSATAQQQQQQLQQQQQQQHSPNTETNPDQQRQLDIEALHRQLNLQLDRLQSGEDPATATDSSSAHPSSADPDFSQAFISHLLQNAGHLDPEAFRDAMPDFNESPESSASASRRTSVTSSSSTSRRPSLSIYSESSQDGTGVPSRRSSLVIPSVSRRRSFTDTMASAAVTTVPSNTTTNLNSTDVTGSITPRMTSMADSSAPVTISLSSTSPKPPPRGRQNSHHNFEREFNQLSSPYMIHNRRRSMPTALTPEMQLHYQQQQMQHVDMGINGLPNIQIPEMTPSGPHSMIQSASLDRNYTPLTSISPDQYRLYSTGGGVVPSTGSTISDQYHHIAAALQRHQLFQTDAMYESQITNQTDSIQQQQSFSINTNLFDSVVAPQQRIHQLSSAHPTLPTILSSPHAIVTMDSMTPSPQPATHSGSLSPSYPTLNITNIQPTTPPQSSHTSPMMIPSMSQSGRQYEYNSGNNTFQPLSINTSQGLIYDASLHHRQLQQTEGAARHGQNQGGVFFAENVSPVALLTAGPGLVSGFNGLNLGVFDGNNGSGNENVDVGNAGCDERPR